MAHVEKTPCNHLIPLHERSELLSQKAPSLSGSLIRCGKAQHEHRKANSVCGIVPLLYLAVCISSLSADDSIPRFDVEELADRLDTAELRIGLIEKSTLRAMSHSGSRRFRVSGTIRGIVDYTNGDVESYHGGIRGDDTLKGFTTSGFLEDNNLETEGRSRNYKLSRQGARTFDFCSEHLPLLELLMYVKPCQNLELKMGLKLANNLLGQNPFTSTRTRTAKWDGHYFPIALAEALTIESRLHFGRGLKMRTAVGGIHHIEYSPLTMWQSDQKRLPFYRTGYEWRETAWETLEKNILEGHPEDVFWEYAWNKNGIKGIRLDIEGLPAHVAVQAHAGVSPVSWGREAVGKSRIYSDSLVDLGATVSITDTVAAGRRFNDDWNCGLRLAWVPKIRSRQMGANWITAFNTNQGLEQDYNYADKSEGKTIYEHAYPGPDFSSNIWSFDLVWTFGKLKLKGDLGYNRLEFRSVSFGDDWANTKLVDKLYLSKAVSLLLRTDLKYVNVNLDLGYVDPFYDGGYASMYSPINWRFYKKSQGGTDNFANPDIHTVIPQMGKEALSRNATNIRTGLSSALLDKGHAAVSLNHYNEIRETDNYVEFPRTLHGEHLFRMIRTKPYGDHYYGEFVPGYVGRGDGIADEYEMYQQSAGLRTTKGASSEVFRYFNPPGSVGSSVYEVDSSINVSLIGVENTIETVPFKKNIRTLNVDIGVDIASFFPGWNRSMLVQFFYEARSVDGSFGLVPFGEEHMIRGDLVDISVVRQITKNLDIMVMGGIERWKARNAWTVRDRADAPEGYQKFYWERTPIDYMDLAWGVGLDWTAAKNLTLHLRFGEYSHSDPDMVDDMGREINSYRSREVYGELKSFF